eukprot:gene9569-1772_t
MLTILKQWTKDENVRRLVSEGTRPRLPWAKKLSQFIEDPKPVIELLDLLKEDNSLYGNSRKCENISISNLKVDKNNIKMEDDVELMIDYSVHYYSNYQKRNISPGKPLTIKKKQNFKKITTRKYYPGQHWIEIIINGEKFGKIDFNLKEE